jgi:hypothetical protein
LGWKSASQERGEGWERMNWGGGGRMELWGEVAEGGASESARVILDLV